VTSAPPSPLTLDRAAHLRPELNDLRGRFNRPGSVLVPVWRNKNLIAPGRPARPALLAAAQAGQLLETAGAMVWLGLLGDADCFALDLHPSEQTLEDPALDSAGEFNDLRMVGSLLKRQDAELLAYARGMLCWHRHHRFCPSCGSKTHRREGGHLRVCAGCNEKLFPRTDPAVMALVTHGQRCLLARQPTFPEGMYSVLAGFVEPGESLEDAVRREVAEEVGLSITDIRYVRSQPWPFPSSLMLGFAADAEHDEIRLGQQEELEDARWFTREQIRSPSAFFIPPPFSLANQLISKFLDGTL
jgi:NAD+ diphosphatase